LQRAYQKIYARRGGRIEEESEENRKKKTSTGDVELYLERGVA